MKRGSQDIRIGLVLGGGAARGWAHIGVIRALNEAGIYPEIVCGTSMGALVGAVYAHGDLDWLEQWAVSLTWRTVLRLLDLRISGGLLGGRKVIQVFANRFNGCEINELQLRYAAVATELNTGREIWFQDGSVATAVRASIAIPGLFTPVWREGVWLVDGGLSNPVPVSVARAMRADFVIAIDLNHDLLDNRNLGGAADHAPNPPAHLRRNGKPWPKWLAPIEPDVHIATARVPSMLSAMAQSIDIMQLHITRSRLAGEPADIVIQPRLGRMNFLDFHRAQPAIDEGRAAVKRMMPALRAHLGWD